MLTQDPKWIIKITEPPTDAEWDELTALLREVNSRPKEFLYNFETKRYEPVVRSSE